MPRTNLKRRRADSADAATHTANHATTQAAIQPTTEEIARRAYELYERRGGAPGAELDDWLQAERELGAARSGE